MRLLMLLCITVCNDSTRFAWDFAPRDAKIDQPRCLSERTQRILTFGILQRNI